MEGGVIVGHQGIIEQISRPDLKAIYVQGLEAVAAAPDLVSLETVRVRFLGRKAALTLLLRSIPGLPVSERPEVGKIGNLIRRELEAALEARRAELEAGELLHGLEKDRIDVSLPGWGLPVGHLHLVTQTQREIEDIFAAMGYEIADGPEVETEYYNFEALNTPADHPARSLHDTFFITDQVLLRTHTSPVQIRTMEKQRPPVHIIVPGRAYRRDSDATHTPMFHQVEGLVVDEHVTLADLKGTLETFAHAMFGAGRQVRLRPHFFPFTEPSVEVDVSCMMCDGAGCRLCKKSGWLEILGAGMVDPNCFCFVDYDPEVYSGFAFGMGIERIAMLKQGVNDLRLFFDNDLRFLRQF
ncbi:MAG TPA: phenylalanine--tRNA ligase subunit alpha [Thermoleophilia bacterium]|nr:phenylalanine--tRNA ligase subunit alpha [Thermoleophilia bacterium]